ncbi:tetratricopeptide repeat protein [Streptomyces sp. NPDC048416]|uniref:tetratricopeptide repeat protein n=1 Tax=Streptomyces sp. NPDC048416 TaxID=3365546 RepID=UPI00371340BF
MTTVLSPADQLVSARCALDAGIFDEAAALYEQALTRQESDPCADVLNVEETRFDLAMCRYGQQRYADSAALLRQVLAIRKEAAGPFHPLVITAQARLVEALGEQGRWEEASPLALETVALGEAIGHDHEAAVAARLTQAWCWARLEQWEAAARLIVHVMYDLATLHGWEHPQTLSARHLQVTVARSRKRWEQAEVRAREVLILREQVLGTDHPHTVMLRADLTEFLQAAGHPEAPTFTAATLPLCEKILSAQHRRTIPSEPRTTP